MKSCWEDAGRANTYGAALAAALLLLLCYGSAEAAAQDAGAQDAGAITGTVTDAATGTPLPGANVSVPGTTIGTSTGLEGGYSIAVPAEADSLRFSFVGYDAQTVAIAGRSAIDVALTEQALMAEELVVTGYQTQRKVDLTGSVSVVDVEELQDVPVDNPVQSLQGRVPGLTVSATGSPGGEATVRIRGFSTLGNNDPLYIIDGVPSKSGVAQTLNPQNIASVQVLKDASSASIYGARASNGVIVITTKDAGEGGLQVSYSSDFTASSYAGKEEPLSTEERGRVLWQAAVNDGFDPANLPIYSYDWERRPDGTAVLNDVIVPEYVGPEEAGIRAANTNWFDEISQTGLIQNHNLSVSSGSERGGALLSLRYHGNQGIVKETDFRRLSARVNSDYELFNGRLRLGENLLLATSQGTPLPTGQGGSPLLLALRVPSILPVRTESGGWAGPIGAGFSDRDNPVRVIEHNRWDQERTLRTFGNVFAEVRLFDDFVLNTRAGVDYASDFTRDIQRTYTSGFLGRNINSLENFEADNLDWTISNTLSYGFERAAHGVEVLAGTEYVSSSLQTTGAYREQFAIEELDYFVEEAGTGKQTVSGIATGFSLLSFFGKADYTYGERYLASFTLRRDGSSRFGENRQFGLFPAFSAGWRFVNEPFLEDRLGFLSTGKLRFGVGVTGNQEILNEARFTLFRAKYGDANICCFWQEDWSVEGTAYDLGGADSGTLPSGFFRTQTGNDNLRWEETTEYNAGLDFGFLDDRLTGSLDVYTRTAEGILIQPDVIGVIGEGGLQWFNGATVDTRGFEVALEYQGFSGDFSYALNTNVGAYRNEVVELPDAVVDTYPGNSEQTILGRSQNALFGYVADGIFQSEEEVAAHADQPGKGVGRLRFADLNGDGAITPLDQRFLGSTDPDFEYGFGADLSYRRFTASLFVQGLYGREVFNNNRNWTDFTSIQSGENYGRRTLDAWTPENAGSDIPALTLSDTNNEDRPSTYYVEDGSYLKLRHAQVGYALPPSLTGSVRAEQVRVYVRGDNLFTLKDSSGADAFTSPDPESPNQIYPRPRMLTLGVNLTF